MEKAPKIAAVMLIAAMLIVYVAAKIHFFTRFTVDVDAYFREHWPYSAALTVIAALLWVIGTVAERREKRAATKKEH